MLLTLTTTHAPATDLGYVLHKNPARLQTFELPFGAAHVFYPEAQPARCTAALVLEVDPVALVRAGRGGSAYPLEQYVNDRPYTCSSFLSVAIARVFGSALAGRSKDRPALAAQPIPLEARLAVLPCRGGERLLRELFTPLGYEVTAEPHPLDATQPAWGASPYFTVQLTGTARVSDLLAHLYVLVPVLDDDKHYWVGDDEVEKLLRHGEGWLRSHPARELIARRYLRHQRSLAREALAQLLREEASIARESDDPADAPPAAHAAEAALETPLRLDAQRVDAVARALEASGARTVVDLGCGEGKLVAALLARRGFDRVVGMDVSTRALERARDRLALDRMPEATRRRVEIWQGSLMYRDARLAGFDAAALVEVIEHQDPPRLAALERVVFEAARPRCVVVTTPNAEYNARFASLPAGRMRHPDHRFEWTRGEFDAWARRVAARAGYTDVAFAPIGPEDPALGAPTQMAVFTR